jgi:hypothetical protein
MNSAWRESLDVAISLGGVINTLWQFYLTVMVAVVAGLLFTDRRLNRYQKFMATIAFGLFAGFNWFILFNTYDLFNAALDEVRAQAEIAGADAFASESLRSKLSTIDMAPSWLPILVHAIADALVVFLIWSNRFRSPRNPDSINTPGSS